MNYMLSKMAHPIQGYITYTFSYEEPGKHRYIISNDVYVGKLNIKIHIPDQVVQLMQPGLGI